MKLLALIGLFALCHASTPLVHIDGNALHRIKRTTVTTNAGVPKNASNPQDFVPLINNNLNDVDPNSKELIKEANEKLRNIISLKAKKEIMGRVDHVPKSIHDKRVHVKFHAEKPHHMRDVAAGFNKLSAIEKKPSKVNRNSLAYLLDENEGGRHLYENAISDLNLGNAGDNVGDGFMYERTLQQPIVGEHGLFNSYRKLPSLRSHNILRDARKKNDKFDKIIDGVYGIKNDDEDIEKKRDDITAAVITGSGTIKNIHARHPLLKRQREHQTPTNNKLSSLESILNFANMLLYNVDNNPALNPNAPLAAPPLDTAADNDDDSLDYSYSSSDNTAPVVRSVMPAPKQIVTKASHTSPYTAHVPLEDGENKLLSFLQRTLDSVLDNDETIDDKMDWHCPVHRDTKKNNADEYFNENTAVISGTADDDEDDKSTDAKNDLIQVCECHFFKKKNKDD